MALEELVLILLDDRFAGTRETAPVNALQRIAGTIVAQAHELR
jgi:hypothetical protein